jgi:hypothetical protein
MPVPRPDRPLYAAELIRSSNLAWLNNSATVCISEPTIDARQTF